MTTKKPAFSTRLNQFWARMLAPINAYLGTALIVLAILMSLFGLTGGHMGGHVDISVMRDGGDVSVRVQDGQMPEDRMPEDRIQKGRDYHGWDHHGYEHHGWRHGGGHPHGWGAGLFGLVLALGLAAMVGLVARLIQIEGHLAALRKGMENGPAASAAPAASEPPAKKAKAKAKTKVKTKAKVKAKAKSPKTRQTKKRG